jgi:hypothetical protein
MYFKRATNHCVSQISVNFGVSIRASEVLVNQNYRIRLTSIRRHRFPAARSAHRYFETAEPALNPNQPTGASAGRAVPPHSHLPLAGLYPKDT